jgi:hypothetical protein
MDKVKKILIEFSWRGHKISQFVEQYAIFKDIKGEDDFWGEFVIGEEKFQYQIWWNGEIAIFKYGATDYCAIVDTFSFTFSQIY